MNPRYPESLHLSSYLLDTTLATLAGESGEGDSNPAHYARHQELKRELVRIERRTAVRLRNEGRINDEVLRRVEHELDLSEERLSLM